MSIDHTYFPGLKGKIEELEEEIADKNVEIEDLYALFESFEETSAKGKHKYSCEINSAVK